VASLTNYDAGHEKAACMGGHMVDQTFRIRSWIRAGDADARDGLIGFLSFIVGDLIIDNVTLRRTLDGRYVLSWPARVDRQGRKHASIRPVNDEVRRRIERQVLAELGQRDEAIAREEDNDV
jgi:DNA-binding cell septation regulator SpoVG